MKPVRYHATFASMVGEINAEGLRPGPDACVYLAGPTFAHAAQFLQFRQDIERFDEVDVNGAKFRVPVPYEEQIIYGFKIDTDSLNPFLLHPSTDHNPDFFDEDTQSYWYEEAITPDQMELAYQYDCHTPVGD